VGSPHHTTRRGPDDAWYGYASWFSMSVIVEVLQTEPGWLPVISQMAAVR